VPTAALRFRPPPEVAGTGANAAAPPSSGPVVWVLAGEGRPRAVPVTTGIADERFTEIVDGLAEGSRVVTGVSRAAEDDADPPRSPFMPSIRPRRH
jgi:multidrug efflux pump subunit AcrA (membrane-fusion protein)